MAIQITADRMIDLSLEELRELNIPTMPCYISMGNEAFEDLVDVFPDDIFRFAEHSKHLAKTAAKSPEAYVDFFEPFVKRGDTVIHFATSSGISSLCINAKKAAERFDNKVYVIDTLNLSNAIAILAKHAVDLVNAGETDADKIVLDCLAFLPRVAGSFLIDDMEFLHRGGRCNTLTYYVANLLKIKPVICLDIDGKMKVREKIKGSKEKALIKYFKNSFTLRPPQCDFIYIVETIPNDSVQKNIISILSELGYNFKNIYFHRGSCNCCVHGGRNAVATFYVAAE